MKDNTINQNIGVNELSDDQLEVATGGKSFSNNGNRDIKPFYDKTYGWGVIYKGKWYAFGVDENGAKRFATYITGKLNEASEAAEKAEWDKLLNIN